MDGYTLRDGINYRNDDGFAFCNRCGYTQVVKRKCLRCDVTPSQADLDLANDIYRRCFSRRQSPGPGFDGRPEKFETDLAARVIAVMRPTNELSSSPIESGTEEGAHMAKM